MKEGATRHLFELFGERRLPAGRLAKEALLNELQEPLISHRSHTNRTWKGRALDRNPGVETGLHHDISRTAAIPSR
jgi:hypothetical protein